MRVTVNQPLHLMSFQRVDHGLRIDIHDFQRLAAVGRFAVGAHSGGDTAANKQRQGKEQTLNPRCMDFGTKSQIARIVGAQRIAVHDQDPTAIQIEHVFFRQQPHPAGACEALAHEKVAVAVNKIAGHAGLS